MKTKLLLALGIILALLPATAQAYSYHPVPNCQGRPTFCARVEMARSRLRANDFTLPWIQWADEHRVLIVEHPEFVPGQWWAKVWEVRPTIWGPSSLTGGARDASILVHEIQHLQDTSQRNGNFLMFQIKIDIQD